MVVNVQIEYGAREPDNVTPKDQSVIFWQIVQPQDAPIIPGHLGIIVGHETARIYESKRVLLKM